MKKLPKQKRKLVLPESSSTFLLEMLLLQYINHLWGLKLIIAVLTMTSLIIKILLIKSRVHYNAALAITGEIKRTSQVKLYKKLDFESLRITICFDVFISTSSLRCVVNLNIYLLLFPHVGTITIFEMSK